MRILTIGSLYPPQHLGGYELVWQAAVGALREAGHEVRVLATSTRFPGTDVASDGGEEEVHRELRWYWRDHAFPRLGPRERLRLERHNHAVLDRHLADLRPHLVSWWHMGGMSLSLVERVRRDGPPAIGWVNDDWLIYGPRYDGWTRLGRRAGPLSGTVERLTGLPARLELDSAARWVFCSRQTLTATLRHLPDLVDTGVRYQGAAELFTPALERSEWSGRLLYVGRIDPRKGIATLLDALVRLPDASLRIVGAGEPAETRRLQARANGLAVEFAGPRPRAELPAEYADADAVVFPVEWTEPYGLVPLEAMAVGRPVIATGLGGSAEYLRDGENALLYPPGDASALAASVRRLAGDATLRSRLRANGFETARRLSEAAWSEAVVEEHEAVLR